MAEAEGIFRSLLDSLPKEGGGLYTDTLFNLGKLLFELGRYEEAAVQIERYLEWEEDDLQARIRLAEAYRAAERYGEAIDVYAEVVETDKGRPGVWMDMAEIYLTEIEDPVLGIEALRRAVSAGFEDGQRVEKLLADPRLVEREAVEEVLRAADLLP